MMKNRLIHWGKAAGAVIFLIAIALLAFSCKSTRLQPSENSRNAAKYQLVKIDLSSQVLEICAKKSEKAFSLEDFARESGADIAINTIPFKKDGSLSGIFIKDKKILSDKNPNYAALCFFRDGGGYRAKILDSQSEIPSQGSDLPDFASGGFWTILRGDNIYEFKDIKNYRSAAATSDDGKTLWLLCDQQLSYGDCARIFKKHGAESAMEFDGGHSSQMLVYGEKAIGGTFRRKVHAAIGFKIKSE